MKPYNKNWRIDSNLVTGSMNELKDCLGLSGEIESIESHDNTVFRWLDRYSGIDLINKTPSNSIKGIASRIQDIAPTSSSFDSFTVRVERASGATTEYEKRVSAIEEGSFYPYWTMQGYRKNGKIISGAIIKTTDLYQFIKLRWWLLRENWSDNKFLIINWEDIEISEIWPIRIFKNNKITDYNGFKI